MKGSPTEKFSREKSGKAGLVKKATSAALHVVEDDGGGTTPSKLQRKKSEALVERKISVRASSKESTKFEVGSLDTSALEQEGPQVGTLNLTGIMQRSPSAAFRTSLTSPAGQEQALDLNTSPVMSPGQSPRSPDSAGASPRGGGAKRMKLLTHAPLKQRHVFYFVSREWFLQHPDDEPMPPFQELLKHDKLIEQELGITDSVVSVEEMRKFAAVTYRWRTHAQPDPGGGNFIPLLKAELERHPGVQYLWFDWTGIPQLQGLKKRRAAKDESMYENIRRSIHLLFLNLKTFIICDRRSGNDFLCCVETWMALQAIGPLGVRPAQTEEQRSRAVFLWDDAVTPPPYDDSIQGALARRVGFGNLVSTGDKLSSTFGGRSGSPHGSARNSISSARNSFSSPPGRPSLKFVKSAPIGLSEAAVNQALGSATPRSEDVPTDPPERAEEMKLRWGSLSLLAAKGALNKTDFVVADDREKHWQLEVISQLRSEVVHWVREIDRSRHAGGGTVTDALERTRTGTKTRGSLTSLASDMFLGRDSESLIYCVKQLKKEQLQSKLEWLLSRGAAGRDTKVTLELWREAARKITEFSRQTRGLKFQVNFFHLQLQVRTAPFREVEAPDERSARLDEFWRHYHTQVKREQYYKLHRAASHTPAPTLPSVPLKKSALLEDGHDPRASFRTTTERKPSKAQHRNSQDSSIARATIGPTSFERMSFEDDLPLERDDVTGSADAWKIRSALPHRVAEARPEWLRPFGTAATIEASSTSGSRGKKVPGSKEKPRVDWRKVPASTAQKHIEACELDEAWRAEGRLARSPAWKLPGVDRRTKSDTPHSRTRGTGGKAQSKFLPSPVQPRSTLFHARSTPAIHERPQAQVWTKESLGVKLEEHMPCLLPYQSLSPAVKDESSPPNMYLRACTERKILPVTMPFITGHSTRLNAKGQPLADDTLLAISAMITAETVIDEIELEGNTQLTDSSIVPLLQKFSVKPANGELRRLSLKGCLRAAAPLAVERVIDTVIKLMHSPTGITNLLRLDVSEISIGLRGHMSLCQAIRFHPNLRDAYLSAIGLGWGPDTPQCVTEIMYSRSLSHLDLSWNSLTEESFRQLGQSQVNMRRLRSLSLAHCSPHSPGLTLPVDHFIECLSQDRVLTALDLSGNFLNHNSALVIEDALGAHQSMRTLFAADNPLGVLGIRSLLRVLCQQESHVQHIGCEGCYGGAPPDANLVNQQVFSGSMPQGRYEFDMAHAHNRAMLRMLLKACERLALERTSIFSNVVWVGSPSFDPRKAEKNSLTRIWEVPTRGNLSFSFSIQGGLEKVLQGVADYDFAEVIDRYEGAARLRPSFFKLLPLLSTWKSLDNMEVEQATVLRALSRDLAFTCQELHAMCDSNRAVRLEVASQLLPCMTAGRPSLLENHLIMNLMPTFTSFVKLCMATQGLFNFNYNNLTGRYKLVLDNPSEHAVAQRLIVLDRWEAIVTQKAGHVDTSQRGNRAAIRNETYQDYSLRYLPSMEDFLLPESGTLCFDYVSSRRPPKDATPIEEETWVQFLLAIQWADLTSQEDMLECLRSLSHSLWLTTWQVRCALDLFKSSDHRAEVVVILFERCVDMHNERVLRSCFGEHEEIVALRKRLGFATYFPFHQPETCKFELDLSVADERLAAHVLARLRTAEDSENIQNARLLKSDGSAEKLGAEGPAAWEKLDNVPTSGTFKALYNCKHPSRRFVERNRLFAEFGRWTPPAAEEDVMWCGDLVGLHIHLGEMAGFMLAKHGADLAAPFRSMLKAIDTPNKNGTLSFENFMQGLRAVRCQKFRKVSEIRELFHLLLGEHESTLSEAQWVHVLKPLVEAARLCLLSLAEFLHRTVQGGLNIAWREIDMLGVGSATLDEFIIALQGLGYYGHLWMIFCVLDADAKGYVTTAEFLQLDKLARSLQDA